MITDIREFRYIVTIAEQKSITKAATQLYVTPSALSKFVQNKELEMGTALFKRIGKQFILTYAGEKCVETARQVLLLNSKLHEDLEQIVKHGKGRIRLSFHSSWSDFFFAIIYPQFLKQYPDIDLKLFEINDDESLRKMDNGELDLAIVSTTWNEHARYHCEQLRLQHMVVAANKDHPILDLAQKRSDHPYPYVTVAQLAAQPIIMRHSRQQTRTMTDAFFHENGYVPKVVLETSSRENSLRAVENGIGVTITLDDPTWPMTHKNIRYLSFDDPNTTQIYINAIYHKGAELSHIENDLLSLIKEQYKAMM